jgi:hypothetical protein
MFHEENGSHKYLRGSLDPCPPHTDQNFNGESCANSKLAKSTREKDAWPVVGCSSWSTLHNCALLQGTAPKLAWRRELQIRSQCGAVVIRKNDQLSFFFNSTVGFSSIPAAKYWNARTAGM